MHPVIHFQSRKFDLCVEPGNPVNPIPGSSILDWLRERIRSMSDPSPEDWGWYSSLVQDGRNYLIGSCAHESSDGNHEWVLQIDKSRSLKEKLLGQGKLTSTDPCFALVYDLISREPGFTKITVENGP